MPHITGIFEQAAFDSDTTHAMGMAYDKLSREMGLTRDDEFVNTRVAKAIIEVARTGERDPDKICAGTTQLLLRRSP